jgi:hypothetical protein
VREYFSGEVETPDKHFFFPSFTLNPLLGSWGKKYRLQKTRQNSNRPGRREAWNKFPLVFTLNKLKRLKQAFQSKF